MSRKLKTGLRPRVASLAALTIGVVLALIFAGPATATTEADYFNDLRPDRQDWMKDVPDGTSLAQMSIPGTHDTLSVHGGEFVQTQQKLGDGSHAALLDGQLSAGIRALDIRVRRYHGSLLVHHGAFYQNANFTDVLQGLNTFLEKHPSETVLLRLKDECTGKTGSCKNEDSMELPELFNTYRDGPDGKHLWADAASGGGRAAIPTLGQVRGKIVLMRMQGGANAGNYGLNQDWDAEGKNYIQDEYGVPDLFGIAMKWMWVKSQLRNTNSGEADKIYINFTSGWGMAADPYTIASRINLWLYEYLHGEGQDIQRTGLVMMDFPGQGLVNTIIERNHHWSSEPGA